MWRGVHVAVVSPHDVGLREFDANGKDNVDVAIDVEDDNVPAVELSGSDTLTVLGVFASSVECERFHGLPFVYTVVALPVREPRA